MLKNPLYWRPMKQLLRQCCGATIIEFAIVAPVFLLLLGAIVEYGLYMFHSVAIESAVMQAARTASIGKTQSSTGPCAATRDRAEYIQCYVKDRTSNLINADAISIQANTVANGGLGSVVMPDICMTNPTTTGSTCPTGTPWLEVNGINGYQGGSGLTMASMGNAGDLVEIRVNYPWRVQIPFMKSFFGCRGDQQQAGCQQGVAMIAAATVLKNEPFSGASSSSSSSGSGSSGGSSSSTGSSSSGSGASGSSTSSSSSSGSSTSSSSSASSSSSSGGGGCLKCGIYDSPALE